MIVGDLFAIGEGKKASLLCEVCAVHADGSIEGFVINGAWDFTLKDGLLTVTQYGTQIPAKIVWTGAVPNVDYNAALAYIDEQLSSFAVVRWYRQRCIAIRLRMGRFGRACGAARRAFRKVYEADSKFVNDEDDLIPF
jgi:hypothetical protein